MNRLTQSLRHIARRLKRPLLLTAVLALPLVYAPLAAFQNDHALLINASPSLPHWAFWLDKHAVPQRGSLIFFEPPRSALLERHFGGKPHLFGKRVLGMPGDVVTHRGSRVFINGHLVAATKPLTRLGVPLAHGPEGRVPERCYYAGSHHPDGFDSRYAAIGFVCAGQILGSGKAIL